MKLFEHVSKLITGTYKQPSASASEETLEENIELGAGINEKKFEDRVPGMNKIRSAKRDPKLWDSRPTCS